jgi:hypothetical protein
VGGLDIVKYIVDISWQRQESKVGRGRRNKLRRGLRFDVVDEFVHISIIQKWSV